MDDCLGTLISFLYNYSLGKQHSEFSEALSILYAKGYTVKREFINHYDHSVHLDDLI